MKFSLKKYPVLLIVISLLLVGVVISLDVSANEFDYTVIGNGKEDMSPVPLYEVVCGGLPYHKMLSHGWGDVYKSDGSIYIYRGCAWQCPNCGLVMVTEGDLYYVGMDIIGKYAILHNQEPINTYGCVIYGADVYSYTSSNSLPGYRFFANN